MVRYVRLRLPVLTCLLVALVSGVLPTRADSHVHSAPRAGGPAQYYLSLGDSLAYGYQPYPALRSGFGYYDVLSAALERLNPALKPVNLGCPGETTTTFINGACPSAAILRYQGGQLATALAFLKAHPGQVSPITYILGANDVLPALVKAPDTIPAVLKQFAANEDSILKQLRAAAPDADIVTIDYYQPLAIAVTSTVALNNVIAVSQQGNAIIDQIAAKYNVKVANVFAAFNTPAQNPVLCQLTWMCSPYHDIHPTIAGYELMTGLIGAALGYPGLVPTSVTNPLAISVGVLTPGPSVTWFWAGAANVRWYDVAVYHYDQSGAVVTDKRDFAGGDAPTYTFAGGQCGVSYHIAVRARNSGRPLGFVTGGNGKIIPCASSG